MEEEEEEEEEEEGARNRLGVGSSINFMRLFLTRSYHDNCHNLERSGPPARALYYYIYSATPDHESSSSTDEAGWNDFPDHSMLDIFRSMVMRSRSPRWRVVVDGNVCTVDLESMALVHSVGSVNDLSVRSVAWMDVEGRCFFPARHIACGSLARHQPLIRQVSLHPEDHGHRRRLFPLPRTPLPDLNEPPPPPPPPPPDDIPSLDLQKSLDAKEKDN